MKLKAINYSDYESSPMVTFNGIHPTAFENVELPIQAITPVILRSPKGRPIVYLIVYKPVNAGDSNVELTRKAIYVSKETYDAIDEEIKKFTRTAQ